jgi:hypothetical protein
VNAKEAENVSAGLVALISEIAYARAKEAITQDAYWSEQAEYCEKELFKDLTAALTDVD